MKKKNFKLFIFITILTISFILFIFLYLRPYNYKREYNISKFSINEAYDKINDNYKFKIKYDNIVFPYVIKSNYTRKRKLIDDISLYKNNNEICILPKSSKITFYPLCSDNELYVYNLTNIDNIPFNYKVSPNINKEYKGIKINNLFDNNYLLYNYRGFYYISSDYYKEITLFNHDVYKLDLVYQKDNLLIIPDYNSNHYFNKVYIINILNGKVKEIIFEDNIYFDSKFLGDYKNSLYLYDNKEEVEYRIDLNKNKLYKQDIIKEYKNEISNDYIIENNYLYHVIDDIKVKISNKYIDRIIKVDDDSVYYLENDNLYMYNNKYGELLLINNFEWNFNNTNMIYLYK